MDTLNPDHGLTDPPQVITCNSDRPICRHGITQTDGVFRRPSNTVARYTELVHIGAINCAELGVTYEVIRDQQGRICS